MVSRKYTEKLGKPSFEVRGFQAWIHGRQYPESQEFWGGNWWRTTIICSADGASVTLSGDILHGSEISEWMRELERVRETRDIDADLTTLEPYVSASVKPRTYERLSIGIDITPDRISQKHYFEFWFLDDDIQELIAGCQRTLMEYPVLGI